MESNSQSADNESADKVASQAGVELEVEEEAPAAPELVDLPRGEALNSVSASRITRKSPTRVVLLVGPPESGKTTLLAATYEQFLDGPFSGYLFAGSETLRAFEDRCLNARMSAKKSSPDTPRTRKEWGTQFLHLRLRAVDRLSHSRELLIADMSGEHYERAKDSAEECKKLSIIRRADILVFLVDGAALSEPTSRQAALEEMRLLLKRFLQEEMVAATTLVQFVITKWDVVDIAQDSSGIEALLRTYEARISTLGQVHKVDVKFHRVAAGPKAKPELGVGYGLESLFNEWMTRRHEFSSETNRVQRLDREFDRFAAEV